MGREEGGGLKMGNTYIPVADSLWYMAKPIHYCKVKIKLKKKEFIPKSKLNALNILCTQPIIDR